MLDEKDLQAIQKLIDASEARMTARIDESEARMTARIDESEARMTTRIDESETRMTARIDETEARTTAQIDASESRMAVLMESYFDPKFNLLAEGLKDVQDKLVPRARVDDLEDDVKFLKLMYRQMAERVASLEKAN